MKGVKRGVKISLGCFVFGIIGLYDNQTGVGC